MSIERGVGIALWRQIEQSLEREIATGAFAPDNRLPTENELAARFGVNRHTLRRAVSSLTQRGMVRVEQGRGTFVQEEMIDYAIGQRTRFSEIVSRTDRTIIGRVLDVIQAPLADSLANKLKVPKGTIGLMIDTLREVDGRGVSLSSHHFVAERFPNLADKFAEFGSLTPALRHYGIIDYMRQTTRVIARMPTQEEATLLQQSRTRPVLVTEGTDVDAAGVPFQIAVSRFPSDRVQVLFQT